MKKLFKKVVGYAAFALAALVPALSANAVTFYLDTEAAGSTWSKAEFYYWWGSGDNTLTGEKVQDYVWKFTSDFEESNYLFKNGNWDGSNQTVNGAAKIQDRHLYKLTTQNSDNKWNFKDEGTYTPVSTTYQWYLKSAAWNDWNDKKNFTLQSDGTYLLENVDITAGSEFKAFMTTNNENEKGYRYGNDNSLYSFDAPKDEMLYEKDFNMKLKTAGKYSFTIYQEDSNWKMKTVKAGNAPEHVYVIGSIKDNNWNTGSTPEMTKKGSKFTLSNVELVNDGDKAKFTLITKLGENWDVVNGSNRFGPSSERDTDASTTAENVVKEYKVGTDVGSATNWLIAAGTYDLVFDYDALTLTITESGATPPEPEPGELSWYLDDTQFTKVSDGEFTLTKQMTNGSNFHIYMQEGSSSKIGYNYNDDTRYDWGINDGDDRQLHVNSNVMHMNADGKFVYTIYRDGSNWKMKVVSTIAVPDNLDLNYKYDNNWQTVGMTKDGSKFKCTLTGVKKSKDYFFHFNSGDTCYQSTSNQNDDHYTNGDGRKLDFKIQNGDGNYDFKYWYGDSECDLTIEIDFSTMKVTVRRSNYTGPVQPDNQYYLLGDVNNWMNDGTYKTNGKEYGYGYSKAENGMRANYQFVTTKINGSNNWYVLDLENTATHGRLWGQFTIIQDNGCFKAAEKEENKNDGRDVINWKGSFAQWANQYDRETATDSYKAETLKAYQSVDAAVADLDSVSQAVKGNRSNFHLDHNLYKGVKIYFNPTDQKIFMTYSDYQDFYIYLSTTADRAVENVDRKVNVIKESMNNVNYTLDFSSVRVVKTDGTIVSDTDNKMEHVVISNGEGDELPNGLKFTNYWKIKIPYGLEGPSGQKFVVSIDGAQDENAQKMTSIFLNNLYFIDGVRVFATPSADVEVAAVSYRIYGLPADGDPKNLQIFAADGTQRAVKEDRNDEFGWVDLQWGDFGYHPTSTSWWPGTVPTGYTQKTSFYPSFKDEARTVYHEVPASHASDCIQWKITYGKRPSTANGMKKTRTGVQLNPATADLTVDRSDLNADWVLNGRHKELVIGVATGVEDIEMEDGEISEEGEAVAPVYYNLQGVRVAEPQHGLYIKVTGNKSEKILVK